MAATNPFLSSAPPQQTSQNQQILDLFAGSSPAAAPKQSALDDLLSLGLGGSNGTNGTATNGSNAFGSSGAPSSNPFADMFSSPAPQQKGGYGGGNGFAPMGGGMNIGMQMGAPQQQFYNQQQPPSIQQPFNNAFGSSSDQGNN